MEMFFPCKDGLSILAGKDTKLWWNVAHMQAGMQRTREKVTKVSGQGDQTGPC
jgi:hypothetical protein